MNTRYYVPSCDPARELAAECLQRGVLLAVADDGRLVAKHPKHPQLDPDLAELIRPRKDRLLRHLKKPGEAAALARAAVLLDLQDGAERTELRIKPPPVTAEEYWSGAVRYWPSMTELTPEQLRSVRRIDRDCLAQGFLLTGACGPYRIGVYSKARIPNQLRKVVRDNLELLVCYLDQRANPAELAALRAATPQRFEGTYRPIEKADWTRTHTRIMAPAMLTPPPEVPPTPWEWMFDHSGETCRDLKGVKMPWFWTESALTTPASDKQKALLAGKGIPLPEGFLSKGIASRAIDFVLKRGIVAFFRELAEARKYIREHYGPKKLRKVPDLSDENDHKGQAGQAGQDDGADEPAVVDAVRDDDPDEGEEADLSQPAVVVATAPATPRKPHRARKLTGPLKWHGGKSYLAPKIADLFPPHTHYVEPFAGGLAVLLHKDPEGVSEVVNDTNGDLMNFWQVLQGKESFASFRRRVEATPVSERGWQEAANRLNDPDPVVWAVAFFVRIRQSMSGRGDCFAPLSRNRVRRGMNEQVSAWLNCIAGLPAVHARLQRVVILNKPAVEVIKSQDGPQTLFYCDPPYLHETRTTTGEYGDFEMTEADHRQLLEVLVRCKGKVALSGYRSELYDRTLKAWTCHEFELPNNAAAGKAKRRMVECLWCNF
jgi:DNA adenine methylase